MVRVSHALAELANIAPDTHQAYVGSSAFSHKAGLHASAIKVDPELYNHLNPEVVGNDMHILITEMAGRASVELKAKELGIDLAGQPDVVSRVVETVKEREAAGWSYEAADASFELLLRNELAAASGEQVAAPFQLESYRVIVENTGTTVLSEATVKVHIGGRRVVATAEGNGPVNALDSALRSALADHLPGLAGVELMDYKVRILAGQAGTDSVTRVLVSSASTVAAGSPEWTTVGVHANVVEASWEALVDSLVYAFGPSVVGPAVTPAVATVAVDQLT